MVRVLAMYLAAGATLVALDMAWLHFVMRDTFRAALGGVMVEQVRLLPAVLFYLAFPAALVWFAVLPATGTSSMPLAMMNGALLGLVAYGTYDLTNLATLRPWTWQLLALDVSWGTFVSAAGAAAAFAVSRAIAPS